MLSIPEKRLSQKWKKQILSHPFLMIFGNGLSHPFLKNGFKPSIFEDQKWICWKIIRTRSQP